MGDRDQTADETRTSKGDHTDTVWNHKQGTSYNQEQNTINYEDALLPNQREALSPVTLDKIVRRGFTTSHGRQLSLLFIGYIVFTTLALAGIQLALPYLIFTVATGGITIGIILSIFIFISRRGLAILLISIGTLPILLIHTIYTIA